VCILDVLFRTSGVRSVQPRPWNLEGVAGQGGDAASVPKQFDAAPRRANVRAMSAIRLDGGEGGAGLLRTALTLSLATSKPFVMEPLGAAGLSGTSLACVRAAQAVCGARTEGAELGSCRLLFEPGPVRPGRYLLDAGASGCVAHLVQILALPLGLAGGASTLKLTGLTHDDAAPAVPYLSFVWLPLMRNLGHDLSLELDAGGWAPEAGGEVTLTVRLARAACAIDRRARGTLREARVLSLVSNLSFDAAGRQSERALARLREAGICAEAENLPVRAPRSKGIACVVYGAFDRGRAGFCRAGAVEADADRLATEAADAFVDFIRSRGAVDSRLAGLMVAPLAVAAAGLQGGVRSFSWLTSPAAPGDLESALEAARLFLGVEMTVVSADPSLSEIRVAPRLEELRAAYRSKQ
jgi:RNA 3'-terminal phosphate cyclase (ATP)